MIRNLCFEYVVALILAGIFLILVEPLASDRNSKLQCFCRNKKLAGYKIVQLCSDG